jgi:hypothetical protein
MTGMTMRRTSQLLLVGSLLLLASPGGGAEKEALCGGPAPDGSLTVIDLLTVGPGDHLFTRFGHSALMVLKHRPGQKSFDTAIYNWGDADFEEEGFEWGFFRGFARFRIATMGDLTRFMMLYAGENRSVTRQDLCLSTAQVQKVVAALESAMRPENRTYRYHHLRASCGTKIRDLLDEATGGAVRRALDGPLDPQTVREMGRTGFAGILYAEICNDLFMGRLHDKRQTKWEALVLPDRLERHLQEVRVRNPVTGKLQPLALAPVQMNPRRGPPPTAGEGRTLIHLAYAWMVLCLALGLAALLGGPTKSGRAGAFLLLWSLPLGIASAMMVFGAVVSTVLEGRINELLLVYPPSDLLLVGVAVRWIRGRAFAGPLLRGYAWAKVALALLSLAGHAAGVLIQQPVQLVYLGLLVAVLLALVARRFPARKDPLARLGAAPTSDPPPPFTF